MRPSSNLVSEIRCRLWHENIGTRHSWRYHQFSDLHIHEDFVQFARRSWEGKPLAGFTNFQLLGSLWIFHARSPNDSHLVFGLLGLGSNDVDKRSHRGQGTGEPSHANQYGHDGLHECLWNAEHCVYSGRKPDWPRQRRQRLYLLLAYILFCICTCVSGGIWNLPKSTANHKLSDRHRRNSRPHKVTYESVHHQPLPRCTSRYP